VCVAECLLFRGSGNGNSSVCGLCVWDESADRDKSAVLFAEAFYDALGAGSDYEEAYKIGCSAIALEGSSEYSTPVLKYCNRRDAILPEN